MTMKLRRTQSRFALGFIDLSNSFHLLLETTSSYGSYIDTYVIYYYIKPPPCCSAVVARLFFHSGREVTKTPFSFCIVEGTFPHQPQ